MNHAFDGLTDGEVRVIVARATRLHRRVRNRRGWDLEDLFQAGALGVLEARRTYRCLGIAWIDYAGSAAYRQMLRVVFPSKTRIDGRQVRCDVTQDAVELAPHDVPHANRTEDEPEDVAARVRDLLRFVVPTQRDAFVRLYGLGGEVRFVLDKRSADSRRTYNTLRYKVRRGIARIKRELSQASA